MKPYRIIRLLRASNVEYVAYTRREAATIDRLISPLPRKFIQPLPRKFIQRKPRC